MKKKEGDKPLIKLKKNNISFYNSKISSSNISYNNEINSSLVRKKLKKNFEKANEKKDNKKGNLKIIEENKKLKDNSLKYLNLHLHHYLLNTVSANNKIVTKNKKEKRCSNFYQKNETEKNIENSSTSLKKRKSNSLMKRNNSKLKLENISRTKESKDSKTKILKINENSVKKMRSSGKKFSSNINNIKIFNGKIEDYLITKELGKGSYAIVKLAVNKNNKNKYAIKIYRRELLIDSQKKNIIKNEINILKELDNINVMKLYEIIDTPKFLYLVMEYINGNSLLEVIKQDKFHYFEEKRAIRIFIQVVKGILYCQSKNICHRDIKLENILLTKEDIVKIIDFGFAVKATKENYQKLFCGTLFYMAPEIVNKEKYIAQYSDIWSLGVLFFAMLFGRFPFRAKNQEDLFKEINEANVIFPEDIYINENTKNLIRNIFIVIPTQRLSLKEIIIELNYILNN